MTAVSALILSVSSCRSLNQCVIVAASTLAYLFTLNVGLAEAGSTQLETNAPNKRQLAEGQQYPGCPPPVLPEVAFFLASYANLELTITAGPDGTVKKVVISKPSL